MAILDFLFGKGGKDQTQEIGKLFQNVELPNIEDQRLMLQQYVEQGVLSPEQAQAYLVEQNALANMDLDTEGQAAQLEALRQLQEIGSAGGLTASDKSKLAAIQNQEQAASRGAREAILQNAQARGISGSGLELMSQMQNQQDAATRQSQRDLDVAAMGQERALQALMQAGQLGGNINQQRFGQQSQIAGAQNEIAKFNAANRQQVGLTNTAANNAAQAANLQNKQNIANANVDTGNKQQQYNKELIQQQFGNQMQKTQGQAGALSAQAQQANQDRQGNQQLVGTLLSAGATAFSDEDVKKDVEEFDAGAFLDSLTGFKYKYKSPEHGEGKQVGVMAQDLEKEVPQMVQDTPMGKQVDYSPGKAGGPIFAGLANLNERLKQLEGR